MLVPAQARAAPAAGQAGRQFSRSGQWPRRVEQPRFCQSRRDDERPEDEGKVVLHCGPLVIPAGYSRWESPKQTWRLAGRQSGHGRFIPRPSYSHSVEALRPPFARGC